MIAQVITDEAKYKKQMVKVYEAFRTPKTMLMVSIETGILRANVCRYVAHWQDNNKLELKFKALCQISKCLAGYYVTIDPGKEQQ